MGPMPVIFMLPVADNNLGVSQRKLGASAVGGCAAGMLQANSSGEAAWESSAEAFC
jgi:hypothetical protein